MQIVEPLFKGLRRSRILHEHILTGQMIYFSGWLLRISVCWRFVSLLVLSGRLFQLQIGLVTTGFTVREWEFTINSPVSRKALPCHLIYIGQMLRLRAWRWMIHVLIFADVCGFNLYQITVRGVFESFSGNSSNVSHLFKVCVSGVSVLLKSLLIIRDNDNGLISWVITVRAIVHTCLHDILLAPSSSRGDLCDYPTLFVPVADDLVPVLVKELPLI